MKESDFILDLKQKRTIIINAKNMSGVKNARSKRKYSEL